MSEAKDGGPAFPLPKEGDILAKHSGETTRREWHTASAYLYPGDTIVVLAASENDPRGAAVGKPEVAELTDRLVREQAVTAEQRASLAASDLSVQSAPHHETAAGQVELDAAKVDAEPVAWMFRKILRGGHGEPTPTWGDWRYVGYKPQGDRTDTSDTFQVIPLYAARAAGKESSNG